MKESKELKFELSTPFNQLKKLIVYLIMFIVQKKPDNKKDIANNKLIASFNAFNSIEKSNSFIQSKMKEIKSIALEYLNQQKAKQDNLQEKLKINSKEKEHTTVNDSVKALLGILREVTAENQKEHEAKLKESYILLKMHPWAGDESKEDFQSRLTDSRIDARINAKTITDVDSVKTNDILADIDDAYKYLRNFASPYSIKPVPNSGVDKEETEFSIASLKPR